MAVPGAPAAALGDSWVPRFSAAATAFLAFGPLIVRVFRGFKPFGIIGG